MIADVARAASSMDMKSASNVRTAWGDRVSLTVTSSGPRNSFGADEGAEQIVARGLCSGGSGPQGDGLAVTQHGRDAEDVVERDTVLEAVRAAAFSATLPPIVHAAWLDGSGA